jgi:hypothetical protein
MALIFAPISLLSFYLALFKESNMVHRCVSLIAFGCYHTIDNWIILNKHTLQMVFFFFLAFQLPNWRKCKVHMVCPKKNVLSHDLTMCNSILMIHHNFKYYIYKFDAKNKNKNLRWFNYVHVKKLDNNKVRNKNIRSHKNPKQYLVWC